MFVLYWVSFVHVEFCPPLVITSGSVSSYNEDTNTNGNYPAGTVATLACVTNSGLSGGSTQTCSGNGDNPGTWTGATCEGESIEYMHACLKSS